jgi:hypothetical protein
VVSVTTPAGTAGVHLTLKTASGSVEVRLGPSFYLAKQDLNLAPGDSIEVEGTMLSGAVIATTVKKGDRVVRFRDARGAPLWSPRGGR